MPIVKSLENIPLDTLFGAFHEAFHDYEVQFTKRDFVAMLQRRGFDPKLSFGAFDKSKLVAFTFNGIGNYNGIKRAYDTGTGTIKAYRNKGLASKIFNISIPYLQQAGISSYLLEVLKHNTQAISIYKKLGFTVSREYSYFYASPNDLIKNNNSQFPGSIIVESTVNRIETHQTFWDFAPSWQNGIESIKRDINKFKILEAQQDGNCIGYIIFEPTSGDIPQLAVDKVHRRKGIASTLLQHALEINKSSKIKVINIDSECSSLHSFLEYHGISKQGGQFEMIKNIAL